MQNETTPRTIEQLEQDFQASSGNFKGFLAGLGERERTLFYGWLAKMREKPREIVKTLKPEEV